MNIIDTMSRIETMISDYKGDVEQIRPLWKSYIETLPEVERICEEDVAEYDTQDVFPPVIHRALTCDANLVREAHRNFLAVVDVIKEPFSKICPKDSAIDLYFYMGLANGAGWATTLNDRGAILICCAMVAKLKWHSYDQMLGLISHELAHEAHRVLRGEDIDKEFEKEEDKWIWQLYMEGFAQRVQQLIQESDSYHQDDGKWLAFCTSNVHRLKSVYKERLVADESLNDFYGVWNQYEGYSDLGYYLGSVWIDEMLKVDSLEEIASFSVEVIKVKVYEFFSNLAYIKPLNRI